MQTSTSVSDPPVDDHPPGRSRRGGGAVAWLIAVVVGSVVGLRVAVVDDGWVTTGLLGGFPWLVAVGGLAALVLGAAVLAGRRRLLVPAAVLAVAVAVGVAVVVPRTTARPQPPATGPTVTIGLLNARIGGADVASVVAAAAAAELDLLAVVEATPAFDDALRRAGLDALLPAWEQAYEGSIHVRGAVRPRTADGTHGGGTPDVVWEPTDGVSVDVTTLHAAAPVGPALTATWRAGIARTPPPGVGPSLVLGDFNATVDHATFRAQLARGWRDAALEAGRGLVPTYEGVLGGSLALPMAIDHVLVSPGVAVSSFDAHDVPGTDHRLVVTELRLP